MPRSSLLAVSLLLTTLISYSADENERWDDRFGPPPPAFEEGVFNGANGRINVIQREGRTLYVGGSFTRVGDINANNIAFWDGSNWNALGNDSNNGVNGEVNAIYILGGNIEVGGLFTSAGGNPAENFARWDQSQATWSAPTPGLNGRVRAIVQYSSDLFLGGDFTTAGGLPRNHIVSLNNGNWIDMAGGVDDSVEALALAPGDGVVQLYLGGRFTSANGLATRHIARWSLNQNDLQRWRFVGLPEDNGVDGYVYAIEASDAGLVIGGSFSRAGTAMDVGNIALYRDNQWIPLAEGVRGFPATVRALYARDDGGIYVGGQFASAGGRLAGNIAKWQDGAWSNPFGGGVNGAVHALDGAEAELAIGGEFTEANFQPADRIVQWSDNHMRLLPAGIDGGVAAMKMIGDQLYAGGTFSIAGGIQASNIARWDGTRWWPLGNGPLNGVDGRVLAMASVGSDLYVGGLFNHAGGQPALKIARWSTTSQQWAPIGQLQAPVVQQIAANGSRLYVASYREVFEWSDGTWRTLPNPNLQPVELALAGTNLFGFFFSSSSSDRLELWDGANWNFVEGIGPTFDPRSILAVGDHLYATGATENGDEVMYVRDSNGLEMFSLDFFPGRIRQLTRGPRGVYGLGQNGLYELDAQGWTKVAKLPFGDSYLVDAEKVYLAAFGVDEDGNTYTVTNALRVYDFSVRPTWTTFAPSPEAPQQQAFRAAAAPANGLGFDTIVQAIAASGPYIYAGGGFTNAGGAVALGVARWDGHGWTGLDPLPNGYVNAFAVDGNNLYAGGSISVAGDQAAKNIVKWDGERWSVLGNKRTNIVFFPPIGTITNVTVEGPEGFVRAIAKLGDDIYVAGLFNIPGRAIARWNGTTWTNLSDGAGFNTTETNVFFVPDGLYNRSDFGGEPPGEAYAMSVFVDRLVVGGSFNRAGTNVANNIVAWDGARWHTLGAGVAGPVYAMATDGDVLYVGGEFTSAGGVAATNVAVWDGVNWSAVGSGFDGAVFALAIDHQHVYAGGSFTNVLGGERVSGIARWDGAQWSALGSGVDDPFGAHVNTLLARHGSLYVGGAFTLAGGKPSHYFGIWSIAPGDAAEWRSVYFNPTERGDSAISGDAADPDGDGFTNGEEFAAGTDPRSAESVLAVEPSRTGPGGGTVITFTAEADRSYTVQYTDAISVPGNWVRLADVPAQDFQRTETVVDSNETPDGRFYRIVTPALP